MFLNNCKIICLVLVLLGIVNSMAERSPEISLTLWVGESTKIGDMSTRVSNDFDADAPITFIDDTYYIKSEVTLIVYLCQAPYPIKWDFSNRKWLLAHEKTFGIYSVTTKRVSKDIDKPSSFTYMSQLALLGDSRIYNGVFTCMGLNQDDEDPRHGRQKSFSLFWEGGPYDSLLALAGKNISVYPDKDDRIVFPCYVNNPRANVTLFRDNPLVNNQQQIQQQLGAIAGSNNNNTNVTAPLDQWIPVALSNNLKYKPEVGFIFQKKDNVDWMDDGNYKCTSGGNGNNPEDDDEDENMDYVLMTFSPSLEPSLELDQPMKPGAKLEYNGNKYTCCSNSDKPPMMNIHSCGSPTTCSQLMPALAAQETNLKSTRLSSSSFNRFSFFDFASKIKGNCLTMPNWGSAYDVDVVQCIGDGVHILRKYFVHSSSNISVDSWDTASLEQRVTLEPPAVLNRDFNVRKLQEGKWELYEAAPVVFATTAPLYYFSHGIRFVINYVDGSKNVLPDTSDEAVSKMQLPKNTILHTTPLSISTTVKITKQMKSISSHVPVWNSSQWIVKTISFIIKTPEAPSIISDSLNEDVILTLNDTDKTLVCQIKGEPDPKVFWLKDDKITSGMYNISHHESGSYILKIKKVTHDVQGVFKCIVTNFAGEAEKTFTVYVKESRAGEITTIIIVTIIILAILIGGGIILRKTILQRRSLENLRANVYPAQQQE